MHRFGYVVELDPYDPESTPRKHTLLGRFKHEAATVRLTHDGRPVVYTGDDERFDYFYKFVGSKRMRHGNSRWAREHNLSLLDEGTSTSPSSAATPRRSRSTARASCRATASSTAVAAGSPWSPPPRTAPSRTSTA